MILCFGLLHASPGHGDDPFYFIRGDADGNGIVEIADVAYLSAAIFTPGAPPLGCLEAGDTNDDGVLNIADVNLLSTAVTLGSPLPAPYPDCGVDPTPSTLGCDDGGICPTSLIEPGQLNAFGAVTLEDFESIPAGFSVDSQIPGVTVGLSNGFLPRTLNRFGTREHAPQGARALSNFLSGAPIGDFVLTFDPPITSFALEAITNTADDVQVELVCSCEGNVVASRTMVLTDTAFQFFGFGSEHAIDSVTLDATDVVNGVMIIDNLRFTPVGPEPVGLLGLYQFDCNALDSSGQLNQPTMVSGASVTQDGFEGGAFQFDGVQDYVDIPTDINPSASPQATVGAWVKPGAFGDRAIISHNNGAFDRQLGIHRLGFTGGYAAQVGSTGVRLNSNVITLGAWTFVAAVYDGAQVTLWVDNQSFTAPATPGEGHTFTRIGQSPVSALSPSFIGEIDNVFIFDVALSPAEIATIRTGGAAAIASLPAANSAALPVGATGNYANGEITLEWGDGEAYASVNVYRGETLLGSVPAGTETYVDATPDTGVNDYRIEGVNASGQSANSYVSFNVLTPATDVIWAADSGGSSAVLETALQTLGHDVLVLDAEAFGCPSNLLGLPGLERVWACLGTSFSTRELGEGEGDLLRDLRLGGIGVYVEGGNTWGNQAYTSFADVDGVLGLQADGPGAIGGGDNSCVSVTGAGTLSDFGLHDYARPSGSASTDQLLPARPGGETVPLVAEALLRATGQNYDVAIGSVSTQSGVGRCISSSVQFSGIGNASARLDLAARYVDYLTPCSAISDLVCTPLSATDVQLDWSVGADHTGVEVHRDDQLITTLPPGTTSYLDTGLTATVARYRITGVCAGNIASSDHCAVVLEGTTDVIWRAESLDRVDSATILATTLQSLGRNVAVLNRSEFALTDVVGSSAKNVWVLLGTFPANYSMTAVEGTLLRTLRLTGRGLYVEGGDTWGFDRYSAFHDIDGIVGRQVDGPGLIDDGDNSCVSVTGLGTFASFIATDYRQPAALNDWTDQLLPASTGSEEVADLESTSIFEATALGYSVTVASTSPTPGIGQSIVSSVEFGGLGHLRSDFTRTVSLPVDHVAPTIDTQVVSGGLTISDVDVQVDVTHSFSLDLAIEVQAPSGTGVRLLDHDQGGFGGVVTTFDDESTAFGLLSSDLIYAPDAPLSAFDGQGADGTWTLTVTDDSNNSWSGTLNAWTLSFELPPDVTLREDLASAYLDFLAKDSDGDGLLDSCELMIGTDPGLPDTDGDGLFDGTEVDSAMGTGCPDPLVFDSDGDSLSDGDEVLTIGSSPCLVDTDGDGVPDGEDPLPTETGVTVEYLEQLTRDLAETIANTDLDCFTGNNNNSKEGRRNSLASRTLNAANKIANDNSNAACALLETVLDKIEGGNPNSLWIDVSCPVRQDLIDELQLIRSLNGC